MFAKLFCKFQLVRAFGFLAFPCLEACVFRSDQLQDAAMTGNIPALKSYLAKGWDINMRGMHGMTPLMEAARGGHIRTCQFMIEQGSDVNAHINSGSVLTFAISSGNRELVLLLLSKGANPHWKNHSGNNAYASAKNMGKSDMLKILPP